MQSAVTQTMHSNNAIVTTGGGDFQRQLVAELDSTHQPLAEQQGTEINPSPAVVNSGSGIGAGAALGIRVADGVKTPNQTPLYERLYGAPSSQIEGVISRSTDAISTRRIREFANAIRSPASIAAIELGTTTNTVIAFAGLETGWGQHIPAAGGLSSYNLFGIKSNNTGPSVSSETTEFIDGQPRSLTQKFRSYQSIGESIADFSRFLRTNPRYEPALNHAGNPKRFIQLVHEAGYATDPDYATKVIGALEQLNTITKKIGAIGIGWK